MFPIRARTCRHRTLSVALTWCFLWIKENEFGELVPDQPMLLTGDPPHQVI